MSGHIRDSIDTSNFEETIALFYNDIQKYCFNITPTKWEGEDLLQESLMKIYLALKKRPDMEFSKRFLFLIVKNTWIDHQRRKKVETVDLHTHSREVQERDHHFQVRESLEQLAEYLSIKQFVIVLLMEVFQFTAKETADFINETESNVHTTLHRARQKLSYYTKVASNDTEEVNKSKLVNHQPIKPNVFEDFLRAFQESNPRAIYEGYLTLVAHQITLNRIRKNGYSVSFQFEDPDGNIMIISS